MGTPEYEEGEISAINRYFNNKPENPIGRILTEKESSIQKIKEENNKVKEEKRIRTPEKKRRDEKREFILTDSPRTKRVQAANN